MYIHEQLNFLGCMGTGTGGIPTTDNIPRQPKNSGVQQIIYPTTDFLKHVSYISYVELFLKKGGL